MQQLWQIGLGWDEEVPPNKRIKSPALFEEMNALNDVKFGYGENREESTQESYWGHGARPFSTLYMPS